jgi:CheY-like chemotaxis protein
MSDEKNKPAGEAGRYIPALDAGRRDGTKDCVLVVDDDACLRRVMVRELRARYLVLEADSYHAAVAVLTRAKTLHAVITDLQLGEGPSGVEVLAAARAVFPDCLRVLVSASLNDEPICAAMATGTVQRYVAKPWSPAQLLVAVATTAGRGDAP